MQQLMRFKYWLYILVGLGVSIGAAAQTTTVSGTVTDSGGQVWTNGTLSYVFQNNGSYSGPYQWNGGNLPNQYLIPQTVTLNGSGGFSISIPTSTAIAPSQSTWKYVVCPNASFQCSILTVQAIGTTQNISSTITAATPTLVNTIQAGPMPLAYTDAEIITTPNQGGIYFNVTSFLPKYFDGTSWHFYGTGGGSGTPGGAGFSIQYNNGGTFGGASFNGIVVASTSTLPTAATFATIVSLWSSCTSGYLKFDGTCSNPSSGIPTTPNNALIKVNGGSGSPSSLSDTGTAIITGEPIAAASFNSVVLTVGAGSTTFLNGSGNYVTPSISFSQLTSGTLTSQTLICGSSCSIATASGGTINATAINAVTFSTSPSAGMVPVAINSSGANWQFLDISFVTNGATVIATNTFTTRQIMPELDFTTGPPLVGLGVAPTGACSNHNFTFGSDGTLTVCVGGVQTPIFPGGSGTVTSIATTGPIGGGTITTNGTITCTTCVVASSPGIGIAHFAGGTQTVTSSLVALGSDVSGNLPNGNLAIQTANTVLGALTSTTPSGLTMPSCSGTTSALLWATGSGFSCGTVIDSATVQALSNKRITLRVDSFATNATSYSINTDNFDVVHITAQTATITGFTMTGIPVDGDRLRISITGTASVPFTLGSSFEASTVAIPTTTSSTARLDMGFLWNTETSKWRIVAAQ